MKGRGKKSVIEGKMTLTHKRETECKDNQKMRPTDSVITERVKTEDGALNKAKVTFWLEKKFAGLSIGLITFYSIRRGYLFVFVSLTNVFQILFTFPLISHLNISSTLT